jgi:hypothetical protein
MPQVYADKNGPILGQKPDLNMQIKIGVSEQGLVHLRIKITLQGWTQLLIPSIPKNG